MCNSTYLTFAHFEACSVYTTAHVYIHLIMTTKFSSEVLLYYAKYYILELENLHYDLLLRLYFSIVF